MRVKTEISKRYSSYRFHALSTKPFLRVLRKKLQKNFKFHMLFLKAFEFNTVAKVKMKGC